MASILALTVVLTICISLPILYLLININLGVLFILAVARLPVYSILWLEWASNAKYALIGVGWAVAQFHMKNTSNYSIIITTSKCIIYIINLNYYSRVFSFFEKERENEGGAEREGGRRSKAGSVLTAENPMRGSNSQTLRS